MCTSRLAHMAGDLPSWDPYFRLTTLFPTIDSGLNDHEPQGGAG